MCASLVDLVGRLRERVNKVADEIKPDELKKKVVSNKKIVVPRSIPDKRPIKGSDWFSVPYANMYACAMKGSGKTTVLTNIIWHCIGKDTKVIIISPTTKIDKTWQTEIKKLTNKGYSVECFDDFIDDDVDILEEFMEENKNGLEDNPQPTPTIFRPAPMFQPRIPITPLHPVQPPQIPSQQPVPTEQKSKLITPKFIIVIDDMGSSMAKSKSLTQLMKTNRHYKTLIITASQHLNDLNPAQRKQLGYIFLFPKFSEDKLKDLYKDLDISITYEKFLSIYRDATNEKYSFLYISRASGEDEFRKKFNEKYILEK